MGLRESLRQLTLTSLFSTLLTQARVVSQSLRSSLLSSLARPDQRGVVRSSVRTSNSKESSLRPTGDSNDSQHLSRQLRAKQLFIALPAQGSKHLSNCINSLTCGLDGRNLIYSLNLRQ